MCYKEVLKKKQQPPSGSLKVPSPQRAAAGTTADALTTSLSFLPQQKQNDEAAPTDEALPSVSASVAVDAVGPVVAQSPESASIPEEQSPSPADGKKKSNRCLTCRKKVGLTGFECRCGGLFCSTHRYSDKHNCSFDYRQLGAEEIRKNNPVVVSEKINKI
jgi:hypothetical protein